MNCSAYSDGLIGVDLFIWSKAKEVVQDGCDSWNTSGTAHKYDLVDLTLIHAQLRKQIFDNINHTIEIIFTQVLELGSGDLD